MIQANDPGFYERVVQRIGWIILALGLAGAIGAAVWKGVSSGFAFLIGAAISFASFCGWRHVVDALGAKSQEAESRVLSFSGWSPSWPGPGL